MYIAKPSHVLLRAQRDGEILDDGLHHLFSAHRNSIQFLLENKHKTLSPEVLSQITTLIREISDIRFTPAQVEAALALYPHIRIELATDGLFGAQEALSFFIAHFFLGCSWPTYGDMRDEGVDVSEFLELLHKQARLMGYPVVLPLKLVE